MAKKQAKTSESGRTNQERTQAATRDPEIMSEIESHVYELVDKYIESLRNPDDIYENNGLFVGMLKYIYRYYVKFLLGNTEYKDIYRYDYKILNDLFHIYTNLVYNYKKNKQPYINEFCIFVNIDRTMLYRIRQGDVKKATQTDIENIKKWFSECEQALLNTDSVGSIFRLKAMFNYNDNLAPIPVEMQGTVLSVSQLPDLSGKDDKKMLVDNKKKVAGS